MSNQKGLTQNFDVKVDKRCDARMNEEMDELTM